MLFDSLSLSDALLRAVREQGYEKPTPIQAQAIPVVLAGDDLLASAQTGTGKTAGFVLPMLQRLSMQDAPPAAGRRGSRKPVRALIVAPTRELAAQVEEAVRLYGRHLKLVSMAMFGGVGFGPQMAQLRRGVDVLVATPGRLLDHHQQGNVDLSRVEILVLDEADRMLDMGFLPDIRRVLALLPSKRQNLLFSATFSDEIKSLADRLLDRPRLIEVTPRNSTVDAVRQKVHPVDRDRKREMLSLLIGRNRWQQVLVFTRTKHGADKLTEQLVRDGIGAVAIHGNKSQGARTRALADFKRGDVAVLVATDIAARGIDIVELPHVVNYDLPNVPHDYVHRIGRTGRAGASGEAISLVCVDEHAFLRDIERLIKRQIPRETIDGFEPDPEATAQPILQRAGRARLPEHARSASRGGHDQRQRSPGSGARTRGAQAPLSTDGRGHARPANGASKARSGHHAGSARNGSDARAGHGAGKRSSGPRSNARSR